jgi:predicted pyridoxine 5'-phosphate oxidase superfamily flavin-nucleotide-binding protein
MGIITEDMRDIFARARLSFAATVNADGSPNLSPKATLMVYDDDHSVFANIASPKTMANLGRNPAIECNVVDPFARRGYRFKGKAEIFAEGPEYDFVTRILLVREGGQYPIHEVVKIRVETAAPVLSPAYLFNENPDEAAIIATWRKRYGA